MTKNVIVKDNYFGIEVADPYRWLEDDNAPEVLEWIKAENAKTDEYLSKIPFRSAIKKRLEKVWDYERRSAISKEGGYYYFFRTEGLKNQSIMYRQNSCCKADPEPELFFDPNALSDDGTAALKNTTFSSCGKYMAYSISKGGSDWEEIFVFDTEKKENLKDCIHWIKFSDIAWFKDGFFYSCYDAPACGEVLTKKNEFHKLKYHKLGTDEKNDVLIYYDENHPQRHLSASVSEDEKILFLVQFEAGRKGNILSTANLENGLPTLKTSFLPFNTEFGSSVFPVESYDGFLYFITNASAPFYKLVKVPLSNPVQENCQDVLCEKDYLLSSCAVCGGKLLAIYLKDVQEFAIVYDLDGTNAVTVPLPKNGSIRYSGAHKNDSSVFFTFTSYVTPHTIFRYDIKENTLHDFFVPELDFDPENYKCEQVFFESKDGTKVPMHIVSRKDIKLDGNNPAIMYGYGGFAVDLPPFFSTAITGVFVENGGIFACVNLRGGLEYGETWHEAGKKMNKQNVFDDFIAAGEYLIAHKYTSAKKLAIKGESNGGLLVGAVTNQRPDLFAVAVPGVGVLDMLRYQHFTIGWAWTDEYGSSSESEEMFKYIYAYSPLHNIKPNTEYPSILITTGDHDDRVVPAHSFKYAQAMHDINTGTNPVLIRISQKAGHGAGKPTAKIIEETADIYSFILFQTNSDFCIKN